MFTAASSCRKSDSSAAGGRVQGQDLAADAGGADDADRAVDVALLAEEHRAEQAGHPRTAARRWPARCGPRCPRSGPRRHRRPVARRSCTGLSPRKLACTVWSASVRLGSSVVISVGTQLELLAVALHGDRDGAGRGPDGLLQARPVALAERLPVEGDDPVAGPEAGRGGRGERGARRALLGGRRGRHHAGADRADRGRGAGRAPRCPSARSRTGPRPGPGS